MQSINYIDLCSGIGGFRIAIENFQKKNSHLNLNFRCILSADIKEDAINMINYVKLKYNKLISKFNSISFLIASIFFIFVNK
jgi:site-specific DNA-cytosine methylase